MNRKSTMNAFENLICDFVRLREEGQRVALVTLIGHDGSAPRPLGSQMVVAEDGRSVGYLTGGCAESVIVAEAVEAIAAGSNRTIRLGVGSPYLDIRLPCGAGIDLYFDVNLADSLVQQIDQALAARRPIALDTSLKNGRHQVVSRTAQALPDGVFRRWYLPRRRLLIMGKGPNTPSLASLAAASDHEVLVLSPDPAIRDACARAGIETMALTSPAAFCCPPTDPWTAAVLLFHEHDWEPEILSALLQTDCFYIGALGSRKTHGQRIEQLAQRGFQEEVGQIHAPVGLDIKARTPTEIAISILAELTLAYRSQDRALLQRSDRPEWLEGSIHKA